MICLTCPPTVQLTNIEKDEEIIADMIGDTDDTSTPNQTKLSRHLSGSNEAAYVPKLYFQTPLPEQNIDKKKQNPKSDRTLVEELQEGGLCRRSDW